jgi:hypothetical protein
MPEGAPKEEMGEGSEGWSDFYGSVRPRHVESEDVRNALWATDEFESDEVSSGLGVVCVCVWGGGVGACGGRWRGVGLIQDGGSLPGGWVIVAGLREWVLCWRHQLRPWCCALLC